MSAYGILITCPQCGGPVDHINATTSGLFAVSIVACLPCRREYEVAVRISNHAQPRNGWAAERAPART